MKEIRQGDEIMLDKITLLHFSVSVMSQYTVKKNLFDKSHE